MKDLLIGKTVAITGAGKGIGLACTEFSLAQGARVVALTRSCDDVAALETKYDAEDLCIFQGDVTNSSDLDRLLELGCETFGRVHGLVNNAGIRQRLRFLEITADDWERVIRNNLTSCFQATQIFARHMIENGGGSIVNVSSIVGMRGLPQLSGYTTAKAGMIGFTKSVGAELAPDGVRVNAVCPGFVKTSYEPEFRTGQPELYDFTLNRTPMGRWGEPEEVAHLLAFLLSDHSTYIAGAVYAIDGGWTAV